MNKKGGGILIFGGSFNPIHIGHLRLAIEARECMARFLNRVEFVPAYSHPWKSDSGLLPFYLRVKLIMAAIECLPGTSCNDLEARREGPSYTLDTLKEYNVKKDDLYFLIGGEDYRLLAEWHKGLEIINYCNIVVAPRGVFSISDFREISLGFWPEATQDLEAQNKLRLDGGFCLKVKNNSRLFYLSIPWLEISASRIRELWLNGDNIDFLVPWAGIEILDKDNTLVRESWIQK